MHQDGPPDRLFTDPDLTRFYDLENLWGTDFDYCLGLAKEAGSVLDIGCGTGELLSRLAPGRCVTGVDPAAAMLEVARQRPGGDQVTWVEADARTLHLGQKFDLVLLTGHAFQVFLSEADQRAVLATIARHLSPRGRFIFDTRNPAIEAWRRWTPEYTRRSHRHPYLGEIQAWTDSHYDEATDVLTYHSHYRVLASQQDYKVASKIRFTNRADLADLLDDAGLVAERWLGDWLGNPCTATSADLIPFGGLQQQDGFDVIQ